MWEVGVCGVQEIGEGKMKTTVFEQQLKKGKYNEKRNKNQK